MTPANPDALADAMASEIAGILLDGGALSPKDFAQRLVAGPLAPILADLQRVTAERDAEQAEDARFAIAYTTARGAMDYEHMARVLSGRLRRMDRRAAAANRRADAAEARAAQLQAEVEAKDRAILLLLPFVDYAAGEGLMFVETEDGEHPEMDAADIMAAVAEALGLELGSDAYLSLLPKGYFAIRTALAARAATAREGRADADRA